MLIAWFHVVTFGVTIARGLDASDERREWNDRRLERAQRMDLAAVRELAQIRGLQLPALQVNIAAHGGQQVNIGGGSPEAS